MKTRTLTKDKVRLCSHDAIEINGLDVQDKFDNAVISLQEGQKAVYIGTSPNFDKWKRRNWETVSLQSDGSHFLGSGNLKEKYQNPEIDFIYVEASYLNAKETEDATHLFEVASGVLKDGGIVNLYVNTLHTDNSAKISDQYHKMGEQLADKGFEISVVLEAPYEEIENKSGKIQMISIYGRKVTSS